MKNFDKKLESFIFNKHSVKLDNIQKNTIISIKEMLEESFFISGIKKIILKKKMEYTFTEMLEEISHLYATQ